MSLFTIKTSTLFSCTRSTPLPLPSIFLSVVCAPPTPVISPLPSFTALWCVLVYGRCHPQGPAGLTFQGERSWDVTWCDFSLSSLYHLRDRSATRVQCCWAGRHCGPRCCCFPGGYSRNKNNHCHVLMSAKSASVLGAFVQKKKWIIVASELLLYMTFSFLESWDLISSVCLQSNLFNKALKRTKYKCVFFSVL